VYVPLRIGGKIVVPERAAPLRRQADDPTNSELAERALRKFGLDIEQASTEAEMAAFQRCM
jgi:hypothetical protein